MGKNHGKSVRGPLGKALFGRAALLKAFCLAAVCFAAVSFSACVPSAGQEESKDDMEFTVVSEDRLPKELAQILNEKSRTPSSSPTRTRDISISAPATENRTAEATASPWTLCMNGKTPST